MAAAQAISRLVAFSLSILVCYGPFAWVLFVSENRSTWVGIWPLLPGGVMMTAARAWLNHRRMEMPNELFMPLAVAFSLAFVGAIAWFIHKFPDGRVGVLIGGFVVSVLLSALAYRMYLA